MSVAKQFGRNVLRYRRHAGLSQEELAFHAGLHRTAISQIERGTRVPRIDTLAKLAGALGCELSDLLDGIDWEPGQTRRGRFL